MDRSNRNNFIRMPRGSLLRIDERPGALVRVRAGQVWLTENGGGDDHVLGAGQSLRLRRKGLAIAQALEQSVLTIVVPETASLPRRLLDALLSPLLPSAGADGKGQSHG